VARAPSRSFPRTRIAREMRAPGKNWENLYVAAGGAAGVLLVSFKNEALKPLTGKTLARWRRWRGRSPEETRWTSSWKMKSRVGACYFIASEDNLRREVAIEWMSFGSDEAAPAPEGVFLKSNRTHARTAPSRDCSGTTCVTKASCRSRRPSAAHKLPAGTFVSDRRGRIARGYFADVVAFDPEKIADHATYADRTVRGGVIDVFVTASRSCGAASTPVLARVRVLVPGVGAPTGQGPRFRRSVGDALVGRGGPRAPRQARARQGRGRGAASGRARAPSAPRSRRCANARASSTKAGFPNSSRTTGCKSVARSLR